MNQTRLQIDKALYKRDINVALYHVEHSKKAAAIKKELQEKLYHNILYIARRPEKIRTLLMWTTRPKKDRIHRYQETQLAKADDPNQKLTDEVGLFLGSQTVGDVQLSTYLQYVGEQGGQAALDKAGISGTFVMKNQDLLDYFDNYSNLLIQTLDDTTKSWIASKIQYGRENFMSPDEIAQMIRDDALGITAARARNIVVTESAKALTTVELQAMESYGMQQKTWHTSEDDKVEQICMALDGKTIALNETFPAGLGGVSGPPAHNFCRCFLDYPIPTTWEVPADPWLGE